MVRIGAAFVVLDPLVPRQRRIQTPVDKEPEAVVDQPVEIGLRSLRIRHADPAAG